MAIVCVGIDLAKNVFAVHGINEAGCPELVRLAVPHHRLPTLSARQMISDAEPPGSHGIFPSQRRSSWTDVV